MGLELVAVAQKVYTASEHVSAIRKFVHDDLDRVLAALGRVEYAAAIRSLEDARVSANPDRERALAVGHLQTAYEIFHGLATKRGWKAFLGDAADFLTLRPSRRKRTAYRSACEAGMLIATCYRALGDKRLSVRYANRAKECFDAYVAEELIVLDAFLRDPETGALLVKFESEKRKLEEERANIHRACNRLALTR